jgi:hypothetical protein
MTAQRIIEPELRSIPLTFMDCPDHSDLWELCHDDSPGSRITCRLTREYNHCPRGFP